MADYASASHLGGPSPALFSLPSPESLRVAWLREGQGVKVVSVLITGTSRPARISEPCRVSEGRTGGGEGAPGGPGRRWSLPSWGLSA